MDGSTHSRHSTPQATEPSASVEHRPGLSLPECAERLRCEPGLHVPALITLRRWSAGGDLDGARVDPPAQRAVRGRAAAARAPRPRYDYAKVLQFVRAQQATLQRSPVTATQPAPVPSANELGLPKPAESVDCPAPQSLMGQGRAHAPPQSSADAGAGASALAAESVANRISAGPVDADALAQACATATAAALEEKLQPMVTAALAQLQRQLVAAMDNIEATRRTLMLKYDAELQTAKNLVADLQAQNAALRVAASPLDIGRLTTLMSRVADRLDRT